MNMSKKVLVIGGSIAGLTSALSAHCTDGNCEVTILSEEKRPPYKKPSLTYVLRNATSPDEISLFRGLMKEGAIRLELGVKAKSIEADEGKVKAVDLKTGEERHYFYDSLVLATGSSPVIPSIAGANLKGVFSLRTVEDAIKISESLKRGGRCVIVGASLVALQIADAILKLGVKPAIIVRSRIMRGLVEPEVSSFIQNWLVERGCEIIKGGIEEICGPGKVNYVKVDGSKIEASTVIFATGVKPNLSLAQQAGIKTDEHGIFTDEYMRTSAPNVYAAGDCTGTIDYITKKRVYAPVGSIAAAEGRIAGCNAANGKVKCDGFLRVQFERAFGLEIITVGHTSSEAEKMGVKAKSLDMPPIKPQLIKEPMKAKIVVGDRDRLIGVQIVARRLSSQYLSGLINAIKKGVEISELEKIWKPPHLSLINFIKNKRRG